MIEQLFFGISAMDRNTLTNILLDLHIMKESIFLIGQKVEKSKNLKEEERKYFENKIQRMLNKVEEIERRIIRAHNQGKENDTDLETLSDRIILIAHDLAETLYTEINTDVIWDIHDDTLETAKELEEKGIK